MTTEEGCDYLTEHAQFRGTAMLAIIEARGTPAQATVDGNILRMNLIQDLAKRAKAGVATPISTKTWAAFVKDITQLADTAGGIDEAEKHQHLLSGVIRFPAALRSRALDKVPTGSSPTALATAITLFLTTEHLSATLAANLDSGTDTRAALAAEREETARLRAQVADLRSRDGRDPPTNVGPDGQPPRTWDQAKHRACCRWGQQGCGDGRHFDFQCPLAPPSGGRGGKGSGRGGRGQHDRLRGRGRGLGNPRTQDRPPAQPAAAAAAAPAPAAAAPSPAPAAAPVATVQLAPSPAEQSTP